MATKDKTAVAAVNESANLPAGLDLSDIMADAGAGVKDMGSGDIAVPYLYVLQPLSPQVDSDNEAYIAGAKSGMFFNNVNEEVYDGRDIGLEVIPCAYDRKYVEWVDRDSGGGYVADHDIDSGILDECKPNEKGIPVLANGHLIIETAYHYVYFKNPLTGVWEQIIIPMKSTMLKKSRRWNKTLMSTLIPGTMSQAPRWLYKYRLKTIKETKGNNTWSNFDIERLPEMVNADEYRSAKAFAQLFEDGSITKAVETNTGDVGKNIEGEVQKSKGQKDLDDDMPF